jgi:UDP-N-acetylmuramoylalanine--D-glutamate ligase
MSPAPVLILGLGDSGLAMARWCARHGAPLRWWDTRAEPPQADTLAREQPQALRVTGTLDTAAAVDAALDGVGRVLKSPGLSPHDPRIAALLQAAAARGLPVLGELDLFVQALAALREGRDYAPRLVAITGTNGKTTTTAMTALLVARAGRHVAAAGNVGPTLLDTLTDALAADALPEVWVLELSSFQLEGGGLGTGVAGFEPDAAVVLNLTQDHLDWHRDMAAYAAAKARVFGPRGTMVINRDDPRVSAMRPADAPPPARGKARAAPRPVPRTVVGFGLGVPTAAGDFGLVDDGGIAWLVRALPDDDEPRKRGETPSALHLQRLMPADALRVRGRHNAANALAALALATAIGCPLAPMLHGLREYVGEPHRVQWVGSVGEVDAFDDSKGTNVGATVAALAGLGADRGEGRLVVILGGDGKGQDFAPLAAPVQRFARAVATLGRDAPAVEQALAAGGCTRPLARHVTLPLATAWAFAQAQPGDAVLLSPACASLDMFSGYAERAAVFVAAVQALAAERGEVLA